jgi:hypothetical protein
MDTEVVSSKPKIVTTRRVVLGTGVIGFGAFVINHFREEQRLSALHKKWAWEAETANLVKKLEWKEKTIHSNPGPFGVKPTGGLHMLMAWEGDKLTVYRLRCGSGQIHQKDGDQVFISLSDNRGNRAKGISLDQRNVDLVELKDPVRASQHSDPAIVAGNETLLRAALKKRRVTDASEQNRVIDAIVNDRAAGYPFEELGEIKCSPQKSGRFDFLRGFGRTNQTAQQMNQKVR